VAAVTPIRLALVATAAAVLAEPLPAVLGLYLTTLAMAGLTGAAFLGYLAAADDPRPAALYDGAVCGVAAALLLADVTLRFPDVVAGSTPSAAAALGRVALGLVIAAAAAPHVMHLRIADLARRPARILARTIRA
jgi:hypothetical protein